MSLDQKTSRSTLGTTAVTFFLGAMSCLATAAGWLNWAKALKLIRPPRAKMYNCFMYEWFWIQILKSRRK